MSEEKTPTVLEVMDGGSPRRGLAKQLLGSMLDVEGSDFMGSGLKFSEWSMSADFIRYKRFYGTQLPEERRRRMSFIVKLGAELERIRARDGFATMWAEFVIEGIMLGDWNAVRMWCDELTFSDESPDIRSFAAQNFAKFVEIGREAWETRPKVFCPKCAVMTPKAKIASWHDGRHVCPFCDVVFNDAGNFEATNRARLHTVDGEG